MSSIRGPQDRVRAAQEQRERENQPPPPPTPPAPPPPPPPDPEDLKVDLPGGGQLSVLSPDEVEVWNQTSKRYREDYRLTKANDLILLGAILSQVLALYRAQKQLADPKRAAEAQAMISKAAEEIRKGEKALGIDKATREKGGQHTVADYITRLKRAAYEKGVHISERVKAYEALCMDLRWKINLLRNGDAEDRDYHGLTPEKIIDGLEQELAKLEEGDKKWAREKAALWVGKL